MRCGDGQVVGLSVLGAVLFVFAVPFALEHFRQAVDHHVQKAACHQAQQGGQHGGGCIESYGSEDLTETENGQIHGHKDTADQTTQHHDDQGFKQTGQSVDLMVELVFHQGPRTAKEFIQ